MERAFALSILLREKENLTQRDYNGQTAELAIPHHLPVPKEDFSALKDIGQPLWG